MSTPTHDHEVELAEVRKDRDKLQKELDAANATIAEYSPKIEGYDKLQAEFDALKEKYQEAEKAEQELESRKVQSKQFDDFTANLRVQLKMAKDKQINVTEAEKKQFAEDVDKMTDINSMARMLSEMGTKKESNGEFLKRIGVSIGDALPADTNNKEFQAQQVQQIMSNYD